MLLPWYTLLAGTSSTTRRMRWDKMMAQGNSAQCPFPWEDKCKLWWGYNRQNIRCPSLYNTTGIPHINIWLHRHTARPVVHSQTLSLPSPNLDADHAICFHSQPRLAELPNQLLPCQVHTFSSQRKVEAIDYNSHKTNPLYSCYGLLQKTVPERRQPLPCCRLSIGLDCKWCDPQGPLPSPPSSPPQLPFGTSHGKHNRACAPPLC